jgi:hypothetical protein
MAFPFSDGLAFVHLDGKKGFIDGTGRMLTEFQIDDAAGSFSEGVAAVKIGKKWGYMDTTGKLVIPPRFDWALRFSEGLARVANDRQDSFIDKTGKAVIGPRYYPALGCEGDWFSEGLTASWFGRNRCGFIDRAGRVVVRTKFEAATTLVGSFCEGMASFEAPGGKYGYLNRAGKVVIAPQFDYASDFSVPDRDDRPHGCGNP